MPITFRRALFLSILSLSLITVAFGQSQTKDFAAALVKLKSEAAEDQLLAQKPELIDDSLMAALKSLAEPIVQKGDYNEGLRISNLALRIAEKSGDRKRVGNALCEIGGIYARRNPPKEAENYLKKCLNVFEETADKKGQARALHSLAVAYDTERRHELAVEYFEKSLALAQEASDRNLMA
ncbi:MAG TPA: tetratricopeptide repeat protein, partial [Pyrinomonadaceae bacterium]|nr:tetratricopeptide repeat protein [Pyrinomonadaceae bacterium]